LDAPGQRVFDVEVEGTTLPNVDLIQLGSGVNYKAITLTFAPLVEDGFLDIKLIGKVDNPKLSAIEITLIEPHLAHSVPGADGYIGYENFPECDGFGVVPVDGRCRESAIDSLNLDCGIDSVDE